MRPGERLGPYELLSPAGSGGMGEVWKARDTRLNRIVAIKFSVDRFTDRFTHEARAIAALNHPHICTLYDVGPDYLVMEFVEGKPLHGPLATKVALDLAAQIADALHCAHSHGVVHRDLKPANVLVTKSGVKLLDFGLAKLVEPAPIGDMTASMGDRLTGDHAILGTLQYMSPEQLEGKPADGRSDLFALGLVLYEMLSGAPAFQAKTQASLIAAILKEDPPPLRSLEPVTPPELDHLVRRCLAKDPDARWQSAADLRDELRWIAERPAAAAPARIAKRRQFFGRWLLIGLAATVIAAAGVGAGRLLWPATTRQWTGERLGGPEMALGPRISPDGHTLAFQAMLGGTTQVAVMKPGSGNWQVLTHHTDAGWVNEISWSADGNGIYYDRFTEVPRGVYTVPALGGDERLVLEDAFAPQALPDGSLIVVKINESRRFQVYRFWPDSGRLQALPLELDASWGISSVVDSTPLRASRDGKEAFALGRPASQPREELHLYAVDVDSGALRRISTGLPRDNVIMALAPGADDRTVLANIQSSALMRTVAFPRVGRAPARTLFTITHLASYLDSGPGEVIYMDNWGVSGVLLRLPRAGGHAEKLGIFPGDSYAATTLVGDRMIFLAQTGDRLRLMSLEAGKDYEPLLGTNEILSPPLTSAGPGQVALPIGPESGRSIAVLSAMNGRIVRRIPFDKGAISSLSASPDGDTIYCAASGEIWAIPRAGQPKRICSGDEVAAEPDGRGLVVKVIETPRARLFRVPLNGGNPHEIPLIGPLHPAWQHLVSGSIDSGGQMVLPLFSPDSWFCSPGILNLNTGKITRLPTDRFGDYFFLAQAPGGQIMAGLHEYRFFMWRFRPDGG
jgi:eukaryotic-like serine/threonine-protein kinase